MWLWSSFHQDVEWISSPVKSEPACDLLWAIEWQATTSSFNLASCHVNHLELVSCKISGHMDWRQSFQAEAILDQLTWELSVDAWVSPTKTSKVTSFALPNLNCEVGLAQRLLYLPMPHPADLIAWVPYTMPISLPPSWLEIA